MEKLLFIATLSLIGLSPLNQGTRNTLFPEQKDQRESIVYCTMEMDVNVNGANVHITATADDCWTATKDMLNAAKELLE